MGIHVTAVLGLNLHHDTSAAAVVDGVLFAAEEERWSRVKHNRRGRLQEFSFPEEAYSWILRASGCVAEDFEFVYVVAMEPNGRLGSWLDDGGNLVEALLPSGLLPRVRRISHHTSHVLSGFLLSPYDQAAGLCIDMGGSVLGGDLRGRERISGYLMNADALERIYQSLPTYTQGGTRTEHSLGHFYRKFALRCVSPGDEPEGSMMALAAYGDPERYRSAVSDLIELLPEGGIRIRRPWGQYFPDQDGALRFGNEIWSVADANIRSFDDRADLAAAVQGVFERAVIHVARWLHEVTATPTLVYSGGCALNAALNATLAARAGFDSVWVPPAPHDAGTAVGAALFGWTHALGQHRLDQPSSCRWGPEPGPPPQSTAVKDSGVPMSSAHLVKEVASLLADKKIVGWCRGPLEFGPRALGGRSVLAHPGDRQLANRINEKKQRAPYRPLAPSILEDHFSQWFSGDADCFMNRVAMTRPQKRSEVLGIAHHDGTARVQLVTKENRDFHGLLTEFHDLTGLPLVLNTSLNLKGKPIALSAADAVEIYETLELDALVVDDVLIKRTD